jgi:nucleoside-diphosphate-sugar epimerase
MGRLNNWLDREDVAHSNLAALNTLTKSPFAYEEFLIHCAKPFVEADWPQLRENPEPVIDRYFPGSIELLAGHQLKVPKVWNRFDITKAQKMLGYQPQHNFEQFLNRLKQEAP